MAGKHEEKHGEPRNEGLVEPGESSEHPHSHRSHAEDGPATHNPLVKAPGLGDREELVEGDL